MDLEDFTWGINRLQKFYNKKLTSTQEDEYYQRIKNIPSEVFYQAIDDIIDTNKYFPTPGELKKYWSQWQVTNPRRIYREKTYCPDCQGEGVLYFTMKPKKSKFDREYEYIARCGRCENWKGDIGTFVPRILKEDLERKGYKVFSKVSWDVIEEIPRDIEREVPF